MTKDEADEKVREAEGRVIAAARHHAERKVSQLARDYLWAAIRDLDAAEAARAAIAAMREPRLMTAEERVARVMKEYRTEKVVGECAVMVDRADILAQAEKLPKHTLIVPLHRGPGETDDFTIKYSDLRNLIQGT